MTCCIIRLVLLSRGWCCFCSVLFWCQMDFLIGGTRKRNDNDLYSTRLITTPTSLRLSFRSWEREADRQCTSLNIELRGRAKEWKQRRINELPLIFLLPVWFETILLLGQYFATQNCINYNSISFSYIAIFYFSSHQGSSLPQLHLIVLVKLLVSEYSF